MSTPLEDMIISMTTAGFKRGNPKQYHCFAVQYEHDKSYLAFCVVPYKQMMVFKYTNTGHYIDHKLRHIEQMTRSSRLT